LLKLLVFANCVVPANTRLSLLAGRSDAAEVASSVQFVLNGEALLT